jgi:Dolichyl-phosphate-mannose-protein mannosyltransferase
MRLFAALGLCLLVPAYWIAWRCPSVGTFHDDGVYAVTAKALAEGKGYRILSLPQEIPQTKYPILFPWLLSWLWRVHPRFPDNIYVLKLLPAAAGILWLWLIIRLLDEENEPPPAAVGIALLCAASTWVVFLSTALMAETLFAALLTAALLLLRRVEEGRAPPWAIYAAGVLAGGAFLTRTLGVALLLAAPLALVKRRKWSDAARFSISAAPLAAAWLLWAASQPAPDSLTDAYYTRENYQAWNLLLNFTWSQKATILGQNLIVAAFSPARLLGLGVEGLWLMPGLVLAGLVCAGMWRTRRSVAHWLVWIYLGFVLSWAWRPVRFLAPVLPLLVWFGWRGMAAWPRWARRTAVAALVAQSAVALVQYSHRTLQLGQTIPELTSIDDWSRIRPLLDWLERQARPGSVAAGNLDPVYYLYTGHKAIRGFATDPWRAVYAADSAPDAIGSVEAFRDALVAQNVRYLVASPNSAFPEGKHLMRLIQGFRSRYPKALQVVAETGLEYRVYEVRLDGLGPVTLQDSAFWTEGSMPIGGNDHSSRDFF